MYCTISVDIIAYFTRTFATKSIFIIPFLKAQSGYVCHGNLLSRLRHSVKLRHSGAPYARAFFRTSLETSEAYFQENSTFCSEKTVPAHGYTKASNVPESR